MPGQRTGHLLRIPRTDTDNPDDFILLRTTPSSSSSAPLDAYLLATEGEAAYGLKLKNSAIHKFIHKAFTGTHEDFRTILSSLLLQAPVQAEDRALLEGIGISAAIEDGTITLAVRKSVGGIKQRIAAFDIPQTEDEIELYNWVGEVCVARDETETKLQVGEERVNELEKEVQKLIAQLKDLTMLKKEHEDAMLVKFQELLNSKKQHIRALTRLIDEGDRRGNSIEPTSQIASSKSAGKVKNPRKRAATPIEEDGSDGGLAVAVNTPDDEDDIDSDRKTEPRTSPEHTEAEFSGHEDSKTVINKTKKPAPNLVKGKGKATTAGVGRKKSAASAAPPKTRTRATRGGSKNPPTSKATPASRGRGRGKKAPETPEPEKEEGAMSTEADKTPPPGPPDDNDVTAGSSDDDEL